MGDKNKKRNTFQEFMDFVDVIVMKICTVLMLLMVVFVLLQVVSRYCLPFSLSWTEELARFTMLWVVFLGASHIAKASSYIRVDFIVEKLPVAMKKGVLIFSKLVILASALCVAYYSFKVFTATGVIGEVSPSVQLPMIIPRSSMIIGLTLVCLQGLSAGGLILLPNEEVDLEEEDI